MPSAAAGKSSRKSGQLFDADAGQQGTATQVAVLLMLGPTADHLIGAGEKSTRHLFGERKVLGGERMRNLGGALQPQWNKRIRSRVRRPDIIAQAGDP